MIEVVSALIIERGRVLLTQRRDDQDFAGRWESPGGKVEGNESWHDALRRELREELGVELGRIAEHPVWSGDIARPGKDSVHVFLLRTELAAGAVPRPMEGQGLGWFGPMQFVALPLLPMNEVTRATVHTMLCRQVLDFGGAS